MMVLNQLLEILKAATREECFSAENLVFDVLDVLATSVSADGTGHHEA